MTGNQSTGAPQQIIYQWLLVIMVSVLPVHNE